MTVLNRVKDYVIIQSLDLLQDKFVCCLHDTRSYFFVITEINIDITEAVFFFVASFTTCDKDQCIETHEYAHTIKHA